MVGPTKNTGGPPKNYKVKYITINIKDTSRATEIAAVTGAELFRDAARNRILKFTLASHARYTALFQLSSPLVLSPNDSSGIFQVIFANALPKDIAFTCYGESGTILSSGILSLDSTGNVGILKLSQTNTPIDGLMLFNGSPNPTTGKYNMNLTLPEDDFIFLHVTDMNGREIYV